MTTRSNVGGVFFTMAMTAALWTGGGRVASAQTCGGEGQPECPPGFVSCAPPEPCTGSECPPGNVYPSTCSGNYNSGQNVNVFLFGNDNSIQVKFAQVTCDFTLQVTLYPTTQTAFHDRLKSSTCTTPPAPLSDNGIGPPEVTCNETVVVDMGVADDPTSFCAVYRVTPFPDGCYSGPVFAERVEYLVGWQAPAKGNKHDFFLLRDPSSVDGSLPPDDGNTCFIQNITSGTVIRNYRPGDIRDPGLGGRSCCPSDYVVARQRIRPVGQ